MSKISNKIRFPYLTNSLLSGGLSGILIII